MKPLIFYQQGAIAGIQQDKYSTAPGFIESKNLDIFSSSQSVKATTRTEPEDITATVVDVDSTGRFELHSNAKVWDRDRNKYVIDSRLNIDAIRSITYIYNQKGELDIGKPLKLLVEWGENDWTTLVVITSKLIYTKTNQYYTPQLKFTNLNGCKVNNDGSISPNGTSQNFSFEIEADVNGFSAGNTIRLMRHDSETESIEGECRIRNITGYRYRLYYNWGIDQLSNPSRQSIDLLGDIGASNRWGISGEDFCELVNVNLAPRTTSVKVGMRVVNQENPGKWNGKITATIDPINSSSIFLPKVIYESEIKKHGDFVLIPSERGVKFYNFAPDFDQTGQNLSKIDFIEQFNVVATLGSKFIDVVMTDQEIYMFSNKGNDGIISVYPQIAGSEGQHTRYSGIEFIGAVRKNNLIYIIARKQGVTGLYVYNGGELAEIFVGDLKDSSRDLLGYENTYAFKRIYEYRDMILLTTSNNVYMYGKKYGINALSNILSLDKDARIYQVSTENNTLSLYYRINGIQKKIQYQDKEGIKNYQKEFEIRFPIQIGTHFLEKEIQDLMVSYILPSKACKLEIWGGGNKYHYRTFKIPKTNETQFHGEWKIRGTEGDYKLKYLESNGDEHTFVLEGDVPRQNGYVYQLSNGSINIDYLQVHHMRKIGEVTAISYKEGVERFVNINNLLNLPQSHTIQIMVRGIGTKFESPELFSVRLEASQNER